MIMEENRIDIKENFIYKLDNENDMQIGLDDDVRLLAKRKEREMVADLCKSSSTFFVDHKIGVSFRDADEISELRTEDGFGKIQTTLPC